ncbi:MAG: hypothetical protein WC581_02580 [Thermodesulfovibrionales bacterium]
MRTKRRGDRLPPFVPLTWEMLNSKAYKDLKYAPAKALPFFLGKIKISYNDPQRYSIEISFSYSEGNKYGFASATFSRVIKELIYKGFIDPIDKGGLRSDGKSLSLFTLSERWKRYGKDDFQLIEWKCFIPKLRVRATSKSETYSFKKGNKKVHKDKPISQFEAVGAVSP